MPDCHRQPSDGKRKRRKAGCGKALGETGNKEIGVPKNGHFMGIGSSFFENRIARGEISLDEIIKIKVPVEVKGEPIGVKKDGGILDHLIWEIEIECKAANVPSKIEVRVDELNMGDSIHLADLELPQGAKIVGDLEQIVAHVVAPREVVVEEEVDEGEVSMEPEVIAEKKEEPEETEQ